MTATRKRRRRRDTDDVTSTNTRTRRQPPTVKPTLVDLSWRTALVSLLFLKEGMAQETPILWEEDPLLLEESERLSQQQQDSASSDLPFFELHPTAVLAVERQRRRLSSLRGTTTSENSTSHQSRPWWKHLQNDWFHPNANAVYATLPKKEDYSSGKTNETDGDNTMLGDFHRYRHLSRYEREFRWKQGLDLQPHWDGVYAFDDDDVDDELLVEDMDELYAYSINSTTTTNATIIPQDDIRRRRLQGRSTSTSSSSTHFGGQFNNYQGVALSQGYGTHYANAWVGSPTPQRKTLIVDTGSHYTAFPCDGCQNCGLKHHTDPYYSPAKSRTFHVLQCEECREGVACQDDRCVFSQSYTEGSSWEAYQVRDKFYCGGNDFLGAVDPRDQKYIIDFMFGCQLSLNG